MSLATGALSLGYAASLLPSARAFAKALRAPERAQQTWLDTFMRTSADTAYGRHIGLAGVRTARELQQRAPIVDYATLRPWIEREAAGERNVVVSEKPRAFERSSGSSGGEKLLPLTPGFLADMSAATSPWLYDLLTRTPGLVGTRSYWSVSPAARQTSYTQGGYRLGLQDDGEYFGPVSRWAIAKLWAVPGSVARIADMSVWRRTTALHLLKAHDLGLVSVWSPSFFTLLLRYIESELVSLLADIPRARARQISGRLERFGFSAKTLWPRLAVVSTWADGYAAQQLPELRSLLGDVPIQPKGLLATEGVVSLPLSRAGGAVAAVRSHLLEFLDLESPKSTPKLVHELEKNRRYSPILTTRGGLVRYHLQDIVECTGHYAATPTLRFLGRLDRTSDLCGEKLTSGEVDAAFVVATRELSPTFALLVPAPGNTPRYVLLLDGLSGEAANRFALVVENELGRSYYYRYCRDLGQLGSVEARLLPNAWQRYVQFRASLGARLGDIKPGSLETRLDTLAALVTP